MAGVPPGESARLLKAIDALPSELAVLMIEHDMDLVFRFARRIVVLTDGKVLSDGTPGEIARTLTFGRRIWATEHGTPGARRRRGGDGEITVLNGITLQVAAKDRLAAICRNGVGKITLPRSIMGLVTLCHGRVASDGEDLAAFVRMNVQRRFGYVP